MTPVPATYFDGRRAQAHPVTITIQDGGLLFSGAGIERRALLDELEIHDVLATTPRLIMFADGASCEVASQTAFQDLLSPLGVLPSAVSRWEQNRRWAIGAAAGLIAFIFIVYRFGLPTLAYVTATRVPPLLVDRLSRHVLEIFDRSVFQPPAVSIDRQLEIARAFERFDLASGLDDPAYVVLFRKSDALGANAMALPSGTIVLTDDIVRLARDDRELLGILAHEAGHVEHRHGLRQLFQSSGLALLIAWYVGDIGSLAAAAPTALLQAKYSRDFEREADSFAADRLRRNGIAPSCLADILERLERDRHASEQGGALEYLASHPATAERIQWLRAQ
ncbi:MAG TPA: M48 family metallopeptidase [Vicinamibacterales bacterium]